VVVRSSISAIPRDLGDYSIAKELYSLPLGGSFSLQSPQPESMASSFAYFPRLRLFSDVRTRSVLACAEESLGFVAQALLPGTPACADDEHTYIARKLCRHVPLQRPFFRKLLQSLESMSGDISRRRFLALAAATLAVRYVAVGADSMPSVPTNLDHILLGVNDLDRGIAWMEERSGVRAMFGGVHPGRGTRNALLSLGPRRYLEIIAPDPAQLSSAAQAESMGDRLKTFAEPRLIGWAAHTVNLMEVVKKAAAAGIDIQNPRDGSRARPDGKILRWRSAALQTDFDGVLPFFIEWAPETVHPSQDAPAGCTLESFSIESPSAKDIRLVAGQLRLDVDAKPGKKPLLRARITGKKGAFELT